MQLQLGASSFLPVSSLLDASRQFRAVRDMLVWGSRNQPLEAGRILQDGKVIARISYNGRVWNAVRDERAPCLWVAGDTCLVDERG